MQTPENLPITTHNKYVIAIDVGNSATKVGLVDQDGKLVASASSRYDFIFLPDGGVEQVPEDWWQAVSYGVKKIIQDSGVAAQNIIAIGTTSQWSVTVPVNQHGDPLMNAISWLDTRGGKYNAEIVKGFPSVQGYGISKIKKWVTIVGGMPQLGGADTTAHMLFIKNELPDIYQQTYKFLEPMDFINMRLTGRAAATQNTYCASCLIDNRLDGTKDYDPWTLETAGIDRDKLPDLLPVEGIIGNLQNAVADEWGLSPATVVITGATDNSVAPIGSGGIADYEAVAVLGTSGMLVLHVPYKKTELSTSLTTFPAAQNNRYILWGDTGNTGKVIDSFLNNMVYGQDSFTDHELPAEIYDRLNEAVTQVNAGSEGVLFLPWLTGGGLVPTNDPYLRGAFINLSTRTTRNHLARALMEGIAYNWRWLKDASEAFTRHKFPNWRISGGGAISNVWAQIMADVIGIPMYQQENPSSCTLMGIAYLALNRLGLMPMEEIPGKVRISRVFEPIASNVKIYDQIYEHFRQCHKQLKPIFHTLNQIA